MEKYYYLDLINKAEDNLNYKEAAKLAIKGIIHQDAYALDKIAVMYRYAKYVSKDLEKSIDCQVKSIQKDNKETMFLFNLAIIYRFKGDLQTYKYFLEKALMAGDDDAALDLAQLYYGISKKEKQRAIEYLSIVITNNKVCEASFEEAEELLDYLKNNKPINIFKDCLKGFSNKQKESKKIPIKNLAEIEDGFIDAIISYERGYYRKAYKQFKDLAFQYHHTEAMNYLGDIYFNGQGVVQSYDKAAKWYHWSVELENIEGILKLANLYKDIRKIALYKYYLEMAKSKGSDKATLLLAKLYNISDKETKNVKKLLNEVINSKTATVDLIYEAEILLKQI